MKNFILSKAVTANQLTSESVRIEFDQTNSLMKLIVSDQLLKIFECELVEEDYQRKPFQPKVFWKFNMSNPF